MKGFIQSLVVVGVSLAASSAWAQSAAFPTNRSKAPTTIQTTPAPDKMDLRRDEISPGDVTPTPEMWFYEQENRRHDDPRMAVRRAAEKEAAHRQARIASRQWYGYSNLRPVADPIPFLSDYSPAWKSNTYFPYQWSTVSDVPLMVLRPEYRDYRIYRH